jgi:hypothetical protein
MARKIVENLAKRALFIPTGRRSCWSIDPIKTLFFVSVFLPAKMLHGLLELGVPAPTIESNLLYI